MSNVLHSWRNYSGSTAWSPLPKDAELSPCGRYCYRSWRCWDLDLPTCGFVCSHFPGLDPLFDPPWMVRCLHHATLWGYGSSVFCPVFSYLAPVGQLHLGIDPVGAGNHQCMASRLALCPQVVCCWASSGHFHHWLYSTPLVRLLLRSPVAPRLSCFGVSPWGFPYSPPEVTRNRDVVPFDPSILFSDTAHRIPTEK